ncbi:MAG: HEAT repeat domain-containing protein [Planctomycetota bacterium]
MRGLLPCAWLAFAVTATAVEGGKPPARKPDPLGVVIRRVERDFREGSLKRLAEGAKARSSRRRVAAAFVLGKSGVAGSRAILAGMLTDPSPVVRRVAAESLYGKGAFRPETVERHGYAEVLAAEERARDLAGLIGDHSLLKRYRATREMIALGWPAEWGIHLLCHDANDTVAITAHRVSWEIDRLCRDGPLPLAWAGEVQRRLAQKIDFKFTDTPIDEALRDLSARSGIDIKVRKAWLPDGWRAEDHRVTLDVKDTPLKDSLWWLVDEVDMHRVFSDGGIAVGQKDLVYERAMIWDDIRDGRSAIGDDWNSYVRQYGFSPAIEFAEERDERGNLVLPDRAEAICSGGRVAAAFAAVYSRHAGSRAILEGLLTDPDPLVRRVAAESLFGDRASEKGKAERYGYVEVIAAEKRVRELIEAVRKGDQKTQHRATRELIALGPPALWQLHLFCHDLDETVALSAAYAFQEVARSHENVPPLWMQEIEKELEQKVTFLFEDTPMKDVIVVLSELTDVDLKFSESYKGADWGGRPHLVSLMVKDMELKKALRWITRLNDLDYGIVHGGVVIGWHVNIDGAIAVLIDVRDLEASGLRPDWLEQINADVPTEYEWMTVLDPDEYLGNHGGLLELFTRWGGQPDEAFERLKPVRTYLNKLREKRGLPFRAEREHPAE